MMPRDYYEILGVARDADAKDLKQAYRRLTMKLHPDRNPGDEAAEEQFKEAAEAYEVLSDPDKRRIYDRFGREGLLGQAGFAGVEDIFSRFGEIFSDFFGGDIFGVPRRPSRPSRPPRGADVRMELTISLEDAFAGVRKSMDITQRRTCSSCGGSGAAAGSEPVPCAFCQGHGQVAQRSGFMTVVTPCGRCNGHGAIITEHCDTCEGTGREPFVRTVTTSVPAGVDTGMRLRFPGEGEKPEAGDAGDLYVIINVEDHPLFLREGDDLHYEAAIPFTRAILGHTVEVPLFNEGVAVHLPPGTQPGDMVTVEGKGMPVVGHKRRGDLHVTVRVDLPVSLTDEQRRLIEALDKVI